MVRLQTRHEFINRLAAESPVVSGMKLDTIIPDGLLDVDAYYFANHAKHLSLIVRGIENLSRRPSASPDDIMKILQALIHRNTYGGFCEIAAYDWMLRLPL